MSSTLLELHEVKKQPLLADSYELHLYFICILLTQSLVNLFKISPQVLTDLIRLTESTYWACQHSGKVSIQKNPQQRSFKGENLESFCQGMKKEEASLSPASGKSATDLKEKWAQWELFLAAVT